MDNIYMTEKEREIYNAGIEEGKRQLTQHIIGQWEKGKGVLLNDRLWFVKSDLENLKDIMDDIGKN